MTLAAAFTQLKTITASVAGVTNSYDHAAGPAALWPADLPAFEPIIVPDPVSTGEGSKPIALDLSKFQFAVHLDHRLYWQMAGLGQHSNVYPASMLTTIEDYFTDVFNDPNLNDNLAVPLEIVDLELGITLLRQGVYYYGCRIRHFWIYEVTPSA